jgi:outer membrane protein
VAKLANHVTIRFHLPITSKTSMLATSYHTAGADKTTPAERGSPMKKITILAICVALSTLSIVAAGAAEAPSVTPAPPLTGQTIKIGFVDMAKIAADSTTGKTALNEVKAKAEKYQKQIKTKEQQLLKQKNAIEAQLPKLSPQQRQTKAKEFQKKIEEFQKFVQSADKDVRSYEAELLAKLYKSIETAAGDYGKSNGFTAIAMKKDLLFVGDGVSISDLTGAMIPLVDKTPAEAKNP